MVVAHVLDGVTPFGVFRRAWSALFMTVYVALSLVYLINAVIKRKTLPIMQRTLVMLVFEFVSLPTYAVIATVREWVVTSPTLNENSRLDLSPLFELALVGFVLQAFSFTLIRMRMVMSRFTKRPLFCRGYLDPRVTRGQCVLITLYLLTVLALTLAVHEWQYSLCLRLCRVRNHMVHGTVFAFLAPSFFYVGILKKFEKEAEDLDAVSERSGILAELKTINQVIPVYLVPWNTLLVLLDTDVIHFNSAWEVVYYNVFMVNLSIVFWIVHIRPGIRLGFGPFMRYDAISPEDEEEEDLLEDGSVVVGARKGDDEVVSPMAAAEIRATAEAATAAPSAAAAAEAVGDTSPTPSGEAPLTASAAPPATEPPSPSSPSSPLPSPMPAPEASTPSSSSSPAPAMTTVVTNVHRSSSSALSDVSEDEASSPTTPQFHDRQASWQAAGRSSSVSAPPSGRLSITPQTAAALRRFSRRSSTTGSEGGGSSSRVLQPQHHQRRSSLLFGWLALRTDPVGLRQYVEVLVEYGAVRDDEEGGRVEGREEGLWVFARRELSEEVVRCVVRLIRLQKLGNSAADREAVRATYLSIINEHLADGKAGMPIDLSPAQRDYYITKLQVAARRKYIFADDRVQTLQFLQPLYEQLAPRAYTVIQEFFRPAANSGTPQRRSAARPRPSPTRGSRASAQGSSTGSDSDGHRRSSVAGGGGGGGGTVVVVPSRAPVDASGRST